LNVDLTAEALILASTKMLAATEPNRFFILPIGLFLVLTAWLAFYAYIQARRRAFIRTFAWPPGLINQLRREHPALSRNNIDQIDRGLRQFFLAYLNGGYRPVSMPSVAADELWHHFILYTREYDAFCRQAFGQFLHHRPAAVLTTSETRTNEGLRRVWWHACKLEGINPQAAAALPLLFALDRDVKFPGGHVYHPDCDALRRHGVHGGQCGGDFTSTSFDGTTDGLGDGSGDGGGDGGGGCGGD